MGNHKFKLSDMMPNAWFYKLKDMNKLKNHNPLTKNTTKSFYYSTHHQSIRMGNKLCFSPNNPHDPPRKSSKKRAKRKTIYMPSPRKINPSDEILQDYESPDQDFLEYSPLSDDAPDDIIINVDKTSVYVDKFNMVSEPESEPRIKTNPGQEKSPKPGKPKQKRTMNSGPRKSFSRVKIRGNARKQSSKKTEDRKSSTKGEKKGLFYSESLAIVKASFDPARDFRESMMEMIVENNIRESKDLEELLACYLSLNSNQYHEIIIKAFEQIWFNMHQP